MTGRDGQYSRGTQLTSWACRGASPTNQHAGWNVIEINKALISWSQTSGESSAIDENGNITSCIILPITGSEWSLFLDLSLSGYLQHNLSKNAMTESLTPCPKIIPFNSIPSIPMHVDSLASRTDQAPSLQAQKPRWVSKQPPSPNLKPSRAKLQLLTIDVVL